MPVDWINQTSLVSKSLQVPAFDLLRTLLGPDNPKPSYLAVQCILTAMYWKNLTHTF